MNQMNARQAWELSVRQSVMQGQPIQTFDEWQQSRQQTNQFQNTQARWDDVTAMRARGNGGGDAA